MLTPNRIAAIATWLTGLAAFIVAIAQTLPGKYADAGLGAAGLLTSAVTAFHYMTGSQNFDALQAAAVTSEDVPPGANFDDQADVTMWRDSGVTPDGDELPPTPPPDEPVATPDPGKAAS
jgi:hypothetical protein